MRLAWTRQAISDLEEARQYIAKDNTVAARRVAGQLVATAKALVRNPEIGRVGRIERTCELVVPKTKYLLIYRVYDKHVEILHVYHSRRDWPPD